MKPFFSIFFPIISALCIVLFTACGSSDEGNIRESGSPEEAADHLTEAFAGADSEARKMAQMASDALRKSQYRKALASIEKIKSRPGVTFEQGVAIRDSLVNLESELISQKADDPKARAAYEMLKRIKRN